MKLFVAMPQYGGSCWQTEVAINKLMREGVPFTQFIFKRLLGESNVVEARNGLTAHFLRSDCNRLLLMDSDMVFEPSQVARIITHTEPVVGGIYSKKKPGEPDWCLQGLPGQARGVADARGLIEVDRIGTGFLCIHRSAFALLEAELRLRHYWTQGGEQIDFWFTEYAMAADGKAWYQGEDYSFSARWRGLGGKIFADAQVLVGHVGSMVFPDGWSERAGFGAQDGGQRTEDGGQGTEDRGQMTEDDVAGSSSAEMRPERSEFAPVLVGE